jgi:hypothetical protein
VTPLQEGRAADQTAAGVRMSGASEKRPAMVCPKGEARVFECARARLCVATDEAGLQSTALVPWNVL